MAGPDTTEDDQDRAPRPRRWLRLVVAGLTLIILIYVVFAIAVGPPWMASRYQDASTASAAARLKAESDVRGNLLAVLVPIAVAGGSLVAYLTLAETRRQNKRQYINTQRELAEAERQNQRTFELSRHDQVSERFSRAIDQLGAENRDVRLGAIYALGQIATDSQELHWATMEILTAYVREHSEEVWENDPAPADFMAVVDVIREREWTRDPSWAADPAGGPKSLSFVVSNLRRVDLHESHLEHARFYGARLRGAFFGGADLRMVDFTTAELDGATFGLSKLEGATFTGATLKDTYLKGVDLGQALGLTQEQLDSARCDGVTKVPPGLQLPADK